MLALDSDHASAHHERHQTVSPPVRQNGDSRPFSQGVQRKSRLSLIALETREMSVRTQHGMAKRCSDPDGMLIQTTQGTLGPLSPCSFKKLGDLLVFKSENAKTGETYEDSG
ncbi:hypothetical protein A7U60_g5451 [Sanghuangporus baumii]|uniref:Uncharacterized protein n=1 Tax=Sanghuangporus baumii TaxID=108892 RepID=A0A9Q5HX41_SANBA|nr:hypothetical protein A7U60_g5451 [Sanghuangporus baumii]